MLTPRKQGRPPRNSGVNGRDVLIEGTRDYLRSRSRINITRTEVAQACGVTPALISYYFKGQSSLLEAVTKPLIRSYRQRLIAIIKSDEDLTNKIKRTIRLLIEINMGDAFLVEYLMQDIGSANLDDEDRAVMDLFRGTISDWIARLMASNQWRTADLTKTRLCLWASCRIMGETLYVQNQHAASGDFDRADAISQSVDFIYAIFASQGASEGVIYPNAAL